ncbi:hypothetical protein TPHA_0I02320 [Tetrapisispora phaffii CBS 4417]|uniref:Biogenesis of lysosome-related organelles complex 1 subunit VAB2 n=1 Tax=Tetrapisispora phaffii (strain ATCC 24235 / CBS 4417 / NBRC 1672 / NRRL Y-8282 / UCD 70-5) TaxID=1071381 RepID=G8BXV8_TETPH|nr:hypothetical protein TPHA_0I02320 [Tetrapisispora phaffii CBS 4417]CCE64736.1 hypothetical protein TPHA_0I02320 [Tetrapisispora phaffii CBS 4417]
MKAIESSIPYKELKSIPQINLSKRLKLNNIFSEVAPEIKNVQNDIISIHSIIQKDIEMESNQINTVESQLKESLKKIRSLYRRTNEHRSCSDDATFKPNKFFQKVENLEKTVDSLDSDIHKIIENLLNIDLKLSTKSKTLTKDSINNQHYPLLFEIIEKNYAQHLELSGISSMLHLGEANSVVQNNELRLAQEETIDDSKLTKLKLEDVEPTFSLQSNEIDNDKSNSIHLDLSKNHNKNGSDGVDDRNSSHEDMDKKNSSSSVHALKYTTYIDRKNHENDVEHTSINDHKNNEISKQVSDKIGSLILEHQDRTFTKTNAIKNNQNLFIPHGLKNAKPSTAVTFETVEHLKF